MMNRGLGLGLMAAAALASASMVGIAAHDAPRPARRQRRAQPEITEEEKKRFLEAQKIAREQSIERQTAAERKRMRKAEKLQRIADKGGIGRKIDTSDIPEATAEQFAKAKVTRKRSPGPVKIEAAPGPGTGTEKKPRARKVATAPSNTKLSGSSANILHIDEVGSKKKAPKKPATAPGKKAPPFPAKKAPVKKT